MFLLPNNMWTLWTLLSISHIQNASNFNKLLCMDTWLYHWIHLFFGVRCLWLMCNSHQWLINLSAWYSFRYTPLSTKELLEAYAKQTVDSCEYYFDVLLFFVRAFSFLSHAATSLEALLWLILIVLGYSFWTYRRDIKLLYTKTMHSSLNKKEDYVFNQL